MSQIRSGVLIAASLATQASAVKIQPSANGVGKIHTKSSVMDPGCAPTAMALTLLPPKIVQSERRRRGFNAFAWKKNASSSPRLDSW